MSDSTRRMVERWLQITGALFGVEDFADGSLRITHIGRNQARVTFRNVCGDRMEFTVSRCQLKPESELPTIEQLGGSDPDFTGGLDSVEYVRRMRGGGA